MPRGHVARTTYFHHRILGPRPFSSQWSAYCYVHNQIELLEWRSNHAEYFGLCPNFQSRRCNQRQLRWPQREERLIKLTKTSLPQVIRVSLTACEREWPSMTNDHIFSFLSKLSFRQLRKLQSTVFPRHRNGCKAENEVALNVAILWNKDESEA